MRWLARFFGMNRVGRRLSAFLHPRVHPGAKRFRYGGPNPCWLCRLMIGTLPQEAFDAMADRSTVTIREPEYDAEGKLIRAGITMPVSVHRQIEQFDEATRKKIFEAMDEITKDVAEEGAP